MWNPIETWLNDNVVIHIHNFQDSIADELSKVIRNIKTAPQEVPFAFWCGVVWLAWFIWKLIKRRMK